MACLVFGVIEIYPVTTRLDTSAPDSLEEDKCTHRKNFTPYQLYVTWDKLKH